MTTEAVPVSLHATVAEVVQTLLPLRATNANRGAGKGHRFYKHRFINVVQQTHSYGVLP
jgi:hypothetical protein